MFQKLQHTFEQFADRNAFVIDSQNYSYAEFSAIVGYIQHLIEKNIPTTDKNLGIYIHDDIYTYATIIASMCSGIGFVPMNPNNPAERNAMIISQAEFSYIFSSKSDSELEKLIKIFPAQLHLLDTSGSSENNKFSLSVKDVPDENIIYILFTSGSTGVPKGVPITRKNLFSFMEAFFALGYSFSENDRFLQMFDLAFDLSVMSYLVPLTFGASIYTVPPAEVKYMQVYSLLEDNEITVALMVPSILAYLRPYFGDIVLEKMRYSMFCGEALFEDIISEWSACVPNALIQNVYGPTEATIFCLTYDWKPGLSNTKSLNGIISIGKAMNDMGAIIIDENLNELPHGDKGEICLTGLQLTPGYIKNEQKNKEVFFNYHEQVYYRTGDIGYIDADGDFMFCGRADHQVKIDGYRIEISEIEHHIREYTGNSGIAVVAFKNQIGNTQLHLFVEKYEEKAEEILSFLKTRLPDYMLPKAISSLPLFPLNSNGKTDRKALAALIKTD